MSKKHEPIAKDILMEECAMCGSANMQQKYEYRYFQYGTGERATKLEAYIPLERCQDCGAEFCNPLCMMKCHEAVCRYLGVLTPLEIRQIRESHELTQGGFADSLGIDPELMKNLERGWRIQSYSVDKVLRSMA